MGKTCRNRDASPLIKTHHLALAAGLAASANTQAAEAQSPVALELVLAIDTSTSVDDSEFALQQNGLANALTSNQVLQAIEMNGALGVAIMVMQWSGQENQFTSVPWTRLTNAEQTFAFADRIRQAPRLTYGFTDVAGAITYAHQELDTNQWLGARRVIDVSGDGTASNTFSAAARDRAVAAGVTINGLVIFNIEYDLGELAEVDLVQHYTNEVIGGPGAFLMTAANFVDFETSMRMKLAREIGGAMLTQNLRK